MEENPLFNMAENKNKLVQRSEISKEWTWKLSDMYSTLAAWEADFQQVKERISGFKEFKGILAGSADNLLACLEYSNQTSKLILLLFSYAARKKDEDTRKSESQSLYNRILSLATELSSKTSFIVPEILAIPEKTLAKFMDSNRELAVYRHYLDDITRSKKHVLSPEIEKVIAMTGEMGNSPNQIFNMLDNADMRYPSITDEVGDEVRLTKGRYFKFMQSKNRQLRKDVFQAFYLPYENHKNTLAATLAAQVKSTMFNAQVRNYPSTLEAALDGDNIPVSVYDNLIATVNDNLEPLHKYICLRKKLLGIEELHMYDVYVSIIKDVDLSIPYAEAQKTVIEAVAPLGENYQQILKEGLNSRWVDVYETEGKAGGAYSAGVYGVHPFVLLNYNETLNSVFTLSHEMGHALHSYFSNQTQPYVYHRYPIFLAEVASTLNEHLLREHLLQTTEDRGFKLAILNQYLEQFRGTVYRQTLFAEFERIIHQKAESGQPLTHELLGEIYFDLNSRYYGPEIVIDPQISLEWARIPHFYMNFYVYKYATGFSAATALAQSILDQDQAAVERYLEFLKSGNCDYPINTLKKAGVDMSSPEPIVQALQTFKKAVDEVEELTNSLSNG